MNLDQNFIYLPSCVAIISTESIKIGHNETIRVGNCDSGPISYTLQQNKNPGIWQHYSRNVRILKFKIFIINGKNSVLTNASTSGFMIITKTK